MDLVAQLVLSSVVWGPAVVVLYWVIRLAVRHGMEDAAKFARSDARRAAAREVVRRAESTYDGPASE